MLVVSRIPKAHTNGAAEALHGQTAGRSFRGAPPQQGADDSEIARSVEPERRGDPGSGHDQAAERRADRAADIKTDAVRRDSWLKVLPWNELWNYRLPSRSRYRPCGSDQERKQKQIKWRGQFEGDDCSEGGGKSGGEHLGSNEKLTFIDDIREYSSRNREQKQRQRSRHLHHRDNEGVRVETRHQPPGCGVVHPGTDIGNHSRSPQHRKVQMAERTPWRVLCDRRWRWSLARATAHRILPGGGPLSACNQVRLLRLAGMLVDREFARESRVRISTARCTFARVRTRSSQHGLRRTILESAIFVALANVCSHSVRAKLRPILWPRQINTIIQRGAIFDASSLKSS